jgi:predicted aspartyl protease
LNRLAALAGLAAMLEASAAMAACKLDLLGEIPVSIEHGRAILEGSVNGVPIRMAVDTGASATMLLKSSAARLGLRPTPIHGMRFYGIGGDSTGEYAHLADVRIGKLAAKNLDWMFGGQEDRHWDIDGLLGDDFFTQTNADLELDLAHKVIRVIRPVGCTGDEVVYWGGAYSMGPLESGRAPEILTRVSVEGHSLEAQIDSGADTIVSGQGARKLGRPLPAATSDGPLVGGIGKARIPVVEIAFKDFTFDQEVIRNPVLQVADIFKGDQVTDLGSRIPTDVTIFPDMLLGMDFLMTHRVYVARSQDRLYISYVGGPIFVARPAVKRAASPTPAATPAP